MHTAGRRLDGGPACTPANLIKTGLLDNRPNSSEALLGVNASHPFHWVKGGNLDAYYLGFDHKSAKYTQGTGREQRETMGARLWSHTATWDYDFEYGGRSGVSPTITDGAYNIAGFLIHPAGGSNARYIGSQIQEELSYAFSRHLTGALAYEHFFSGAFLKATQPGHSLNFLSPQLTWNF